MSAVRKHSVTIRGHRTSFSLEDAFFIELEAIAARRSVPLAALITEIDAARPHSSNLSSALRLYVLEWFTGNRLESPADRPDANKQPGFSA